MRKNLGGIVLELGLYPEALLNQLMVQLSKQHGYGLTVSSFDKDFLLVRAVVV